jgi:surface carbohydrate biosynthesis protein
VLPVESIPRELDGKILLALAARERGWKVILGDQKIVKRLVLSLPCCVYLGKSARSTNARLFTRLNALGHKVAVLDEEALVRATDQIYLMKHERDALSNVCLLFTWGSDTTELWRRTGLIAESSIRTVGNPRIDLLRPELRSYLQPEIDAIRQRFGDYVLFNTNFLTVNSFVTKNKFRLAEWVPEQELTAQRSGLLGHKKQIFDRFRALVPKIAGAIAPLRLIIRPHPSEDHAPWREAASNLGNATVIFEGSVAPWLAGARALLHSGCTSAVESAVVGTTALAYRPVISDLYDDVLTNAVSISCPSDEALLKELSHVLTNGPVALKKDQRRELERCVAATNGPLACDVIMNELDGIAPEPGSFSPSWMVKAWCHWDHHRQVMPLRIKQFSAKGKRRAAYMRHKFPGLSSDDVNVRIGRFKAALGRFDGLAARQLAPDVVQFG